MNQTWTSFLTERKALTHSETTGNLANELDARTGRVYPVLGLAVLKVAGKDAAQFLQGQVTCNIHDVTETRGSFGAYCNPKGRVIASFIVLKSCGDFLLILPHSLFGSVIEKLRKYILRADVKLTDCSNEFCLIGITNDETSNSSLNFPEHDLDVSAETYRLLKLPSNRDRYLAVTDVDQAMLLWARLCEENGYRSGAYEKWQLLDIEDRIPWLEPETSEEFIPQMLNIDRLGGISFNKGCYTGQEIVARTHYLGKTKRMLFLAESDCEWAPPPNTTIIDSSGQAIGKVLRAMTDRGSTKMLAVIPSAEIDAVNLSLNTSGNNKVRIIRL